MEDFAVAVLVVTPPGIPLIRDPKKPAPLFWKLPGGRSEGVETAPQAALRELKEEIGFSLREADLKIIHKERRDSHTLLVYRADLAELPALKRKGNEREEIRIFRPAEILAMNDFFPNHRRIIEEILKTL